MALPAVPPVEQAEDVGQRIRHAIRALIGERRTSVRRLAKEYSEVAPRQMTETMLHARLNGPTRFAIEEAALLANLLGLTFDELVTLSREKWLTTSRWYRQTLHLSAVQFPDDEQLEFPTESVFPPHLALTL